MEYNTTIGVDVSDRTSKICVLRKEPDGARRIVVETTCATTRAGFGEALAKFDRSWPVVFETGTHCRWMDRLIGSLGFKTIVEIYQQMLRYHHARNMLVSQRT